MVSTAQVSFGRWLLALVICLYLTDLSESVGVVARMRDKMAPVLKEMNRLAIDDGERALMSKRDLLMKALDEAEDEQNEAESAQVMKASESHEAYEEQMEPQDAPALADQEKSSAPIKRSQENGKRGRLNRPVIHAGK